MEDYDGRVVALIHRSGGDQPPRGLQVTWTVMERPSIITAPGAPKATARALVATFVRDMAAHLDDDNTAIGFARYVRVSPADAEAAPIPLPEMGNPPYRVEWGAN